MIPLAFATCPYCQSPTEYVDSAKIYKTSYGPALACSRFPFCDSYVGCHTATGLPKGTVANKYLRLWRKKAHAVFDALWAPATGVPLFKRSAAYFWLAEAIGVPLEDCHIGMMDAAKCAQVVDACVKHTASPVVPPSSGVYVDWLMPHGWVLRGKRVTSCHMYAATLDLEPLHLLAERIGLERRWLDAKGLVPHYDLTEGKRALALAAGAQPIDDRAGFARIYRPIRDMWLAEKGRAGAIRDAAIWSPLP